MAEATIHTVRAMIKGVDQAPRKVSLVAALVRGRSVADAEVILDHTPKRAALAVKKAIKSAAANAVENHGLDAKSLEITTLSVTAGSRMRRYKPASRGRALPFEKKSSHILVEVFEDAHDARTLGARPVGGDGHPVHFDRGVQLTRQVCHNHDGPSQDADDEQFPTRVVAVNLLGHLAEPTVHVLGSDEDFLQIVSHVGGVHRVLFSYRRSASGCTISVP